MWQQERTCKILFQCRETFCDDSEVRFTHGALEIYENTDFFYKRDIVSICKLSLVQPVTFDPLDLT